MGINMYMYKLENSPSKLQTQFIPNSFSVCINKVFFFYFDLISNRRHDNKFRVSYLYSKNYPVEDGNEILLL